MKPSTVLFSVFMVVALSGYGLSDATPAHGGCSIPDKFPPELDNHKDWPNLNCSRSIVEQVQRELKASLTYLAMGAYFTSDHYYRPGTAGFFLEGANEERQHAKALMEYVLMRGSKISITDMPFEITPTKREWKSVSDALSDALQIEKDVRQNFKDIIAVCENFQGYNDYHAADLLTGTFLEEQHQSIRKIAEHLATLSRMQTNKHYGKFAEIMFDKTLIS